MKKRGALELSVGTLVVIVLALTMLILGFVLIRTIFKGATENVTIIDEKVKEEINSLFVDEDKTVIVKLAERTAKIRAGTQGFGIAVAARTSDGAQIITRDQLQYMLTLDTTTSNNCYNTLGEANIEALFSQSLETLISFDEYEGDSAFAIVQVDIPSGTQLCSQKVFIDVQDSESGENIGGSFFIVQILRKGVF